MNHRGKKKSKSLSTASSGDSHHISSLESHRPTLTLNGGRFVKATFHDLAQNIFGHGGFLERHAGLGYTRSHHHNLLGSTPRVCIRIRSLGDIRVFNVEVLLKGNELCLRKVNAGESGTEATPATSTEATAATEATEATSSSTVTTSSPAKAYRESGSKQS